MGLKIDLSYFPKVKLEIRGIDYTALLSIRRPWLEANPKGYPVR
jgi:hypothetical protein